MTLGAVTLETKKKYIPLLARYVNDMQLNGYNEGLKGF